MSFVSPRDTSLERSGNTPRIATRCLPRDFVARGADVRESTRILFRVIDTWSPANDRPDVDKPQPPRLFGSLWVEDSRELMAIQAKASIDERFLTVTEVAERLEVNDDTVRRLFANEPGVVSICFPRKGRRVYRTLRIPQNVFERVLTRLTKIAQAACMGATSIYHAFFTAFFTATSRRC